ncbi:hypothetical protein N9Y60_00230 [Crocinitomicaceae bacterium]|nr:hypothetical protein [Crocinitomicaceae bacterium]MDB3906785.1 hypothetical protein [Crocinitomicaceae bacterium]
MKNLLLIPIFLIATVYTFAAEAPKGDDPYEEAAKQMCDCVNQSLGLLSERMVNAIVDADGDDAILEAELEKYAEENLDGMIADLEMLEGSMLDDMTNCFDRVAGNFEDVYTDDSDEEVEAKIIETMASQEGCENSVAFFRLGIGMQDGEESEVQTEGESTRVEDEIDEHLIMADDLCICINEVTIPMSERLVVILADSGGDAATVKEMLNEYLSEDEKAAKKDMAVMGEIDTDIESCIARIESDYDNLFEQESEEIIREQLLYHLENIDGCEVAYGVINLYFNLED